MEAEKLYSQLEKDFITPAMRDEWIKYMEEIADFWDTHSLAGYWDQTREVQFEVRAKRRRRVTLAPEVYAEVEAQARARGVLPEPLVNLWLAERLQSDVRQAATDAA